MVGSDLPISTDVPHELRFAPLQSGDIGAGPRRARSADQLVLDLESLGSELLADLRSISASDATAPSLCAGWSVRDIVLHFVVGDERGLAVLRGEDPFPDPTPDESILGRRSLEWVAELGDIPMDDAVDRFADARSQLMEAIGGVGSDEWGSYLPWGAKPITRFSMVQSRLMETWVHGWDARWPLSIPQPFDDRLWWVTDIAVRHVPYALAKAELALPRARLRVELTGPAGGAWDRTLGTPVDEEVSIEGPAWAWAVWSTQRAPGRLGASRLVVTPGPTADLIVRHARCFA